MEMTHPPKAIGSSKITFYKRYVNFAISGWDQSDRLYNPAARLCWAFVSLTSWVMARNDCHFLLVSNVLYLQGRSLFSKAIWVQLLDLLRKLCCWDVLALTSSFKSIINPDWPCVRSNFSCFKYWKFQSAGAMGRLEFASISKCPEAFSCRDWEPSIC